MMDSISTVTERGRAEARVSLDHIRDGFPDNPETMQYFYDLFERTYCDGEPIPIEGKAIGTTCIQVPEELIYAAGGTPVRLCNGSYANAQVGDEFLPAKTCPLVSATIGSLHAKQNILSKEIDLVVNPTTCDPKRKTGWLIEEMGYELYTMEIPSVKDSDDAREYWRRSVHRFGRKLEQVTGKRVTSRSLRQAVARVGSATQEYRRFHRLRQTDPLVILGKDAMLVSNAYFFDDIDRWREALARLNDELEARMNAKILRRMRRAPRILFTGSPPIFPNLKMPLLVEELGGVIVADEVCSSTRMLYDAVAYDEPTLHDMVPAIADRSLKPCTCPYFAVNEDRKRRLLELARTARIDGVIYQAFSGCQVYELEQMSVGRTLAEADIPMLYVETDYNADDAGQLTTRIEAFLESIQARKRKQRR